jgi:MFS transporter, putative metabolite transport protein
MNNNDKYKSTNTPKSVQEYIDETPQWSDGTKTSSTPMTSMQWRIWWLASAGKFFEGMIVFMTGVALPLLVMEFGLSDIEKGIVSSSSLFGILVGATLLGSLADKFGRKTMFIVELLLFAVFLVLTALSPNFVYLSIFLFGLGASLGCDYPTAHMVISESIPSAARGKLVLSAFGFQAVGALVGTAVGFVVLQLDPELSAWRWMYASTIVPTILVIFGRFFITESGHWLASRGRHSHAEQELVKLLRRDPPYPKEVFLHRANDESKPKKQSFLALFNKKNRRATMLASIPWFIQDLGTYGIGIFTPIILASTIGGEEHYNNSVASLIHNDILAAKGAAFLDIFLIVGIFLAIIFTDKVGRIKLQVYGFIGCAIGLLLASFSMDSDGNTNTTLLFVGFIMFNLMTNMGPNAQTYLLAGEVFPTEIRGKGAGFAASFAKIGAVLTVFLFPIMLKDLGTEIIMYFLIVTSIVGAIVTHMLRIETRGVNLETIGKE